MKKAMKTPLVAAVGSAVVSSLGAGAANAEANPFAMSELTDGYMQVAEADKSNEMKCGASMGMKEGSCGEGKCGAMMGDVKIEEGKCAGNKGKAADMSKKGQKMQGMQGNGMQGKGMQGNGMQGKGMEGKCGEGKCGSMMENGKMKKGMEGSCGDMMKGKEGSCGDMVGKGKKGWPVNKK